MFAAEGNPFNYEALYSGTYLDADGSNSGITRPALGSDVSLLLINSREDKILNSEYTCRHFLWQS